MYSVEIRKELGSILKKLSKKDKISSIYLSKKIKEIAGNPYHFKPLKSPLQNYRRVHIGNFVLIYSISENKKSIILERYKHHDEVYKT